MKYEYFRDKQNKVVAGVMNTVDTDAHNHNILEILYIESGELEVKVDDECFCARTGEFIAVSSFAVHSYKSKCPGKYLLLMVPRKNDLRTSINFDSMCFERPVCNDKSGNMYGIFKVLLNLYYEYFDRSSEMKLVENLASAAVELAVLTCSLKPKSNTSELITRTVEYISKHFSENIRVCDIAKDLGCYQQTMSKLFSSAFGISITGYINRQKIIEAKSIMDDNPRLTLEEIANLTGFGSIRSLLRAYKKEYGGTPKNHNK